MLDRRETLRLIAGTTAAFFAGNGLVSRLRAETTPASQHSAVLTPEQEEGPFYISSEHIRRDVSEGKPGVPLELRIALVDVHSGHPISGAAVDIWHCDAVGVYSGFANRHPGPPPDPDDSFDGDEGGPPPDFHDGEAPGRRALPTGGANFLRGVQLTDDTGMAAFRTIYPGWYAGREIHIHLKTHLDGSSAKNIYTGGHVCHTGQLFFPDETNAAVSRLEPYTSSKTPRTTKATDHVYREQNGDKTVMMMQLLSTGADSVYQARIVLAVDPSASPRPVGMR